MDGSKETSEFEVVLAKKNANPKKKVIKFSQ